MPDTLRFPNYTNLMQKIKILQPYFRGHSVFYLFSNSNDYNVKIKILQFDLLQKENWLNHKYSYIELGIQISNESYLFVLTKHFFKTKSGFITKNSCRYLN